MTASAEVPVTGPLVADGQPVPVNKQSQAAVAANVPLSYPGDPVPKYPRVKNAMEEMGLQKKVADDHCHSTSEWYYIKHVGFNDIEFSVGKDGKGPLAYYIDVKARFVGWSIIVRRPDGTPIMQLKKDITFARLLAWDKGTSVDISHAHEDEFGRKDSNGSDSSFSSKNSLESMKRKMLVKMKRTKKALQTKEKVQGEPEDGAIIVPDGNKSEYDELDEKDLAELPAKKITAIHRKHAFRSNANEFIYNGNVYEWNYWIFLGSNLKLTDKTTGDVMAEVQLLPTWRVQIITSWSWRLDGVLEIKENAKRLGMQDIIVTTLCAMLEWRKHNNKVWIVAAAIA